MTEEFINEAIENALAGKSNLDESILQIRGFSTHTMRRLVHNLCEGQSKYLEVGLFCGATFCSSFNSELLSIGIEDYSQDFGEVGVEETLIKNVTLYEGQSKMVQLILRDCFSIDLSDLPDNIDIYFYDGNHSLDDQAKALPHFIDKMANRFIFIVDDTNWPEVAAGTKKGMEILADKIVIQEEWNLVGKQLQDDPIFHNGMKIFLIDRK